MDIKFGKVKTTNSNNIFLTPLPNHSGENFFAFNSDSKKNNQQQRPTFSPRINDYDSNLIQNNAYQEMPDEIFRLEHKITTLEQLLSKINTEIETLENLGYDIQIYNLKDRKQRIERELIELNEQYSQLGLSAKISGQIAAAVNVSNKKMNIFLRIKKLFSKKVLSKFSKKFYYNQRITEALSNLSDINSSVDDLINMQAPYGENITRYEKLTAYLNKANIIHSQINQNVNQITKKKA